MYSVLLDVCKVPAVEPVCLTQAVTGLCPWLPGLAQQRALCVAGSCYLQPAFPLQQTCNVRVRGASHALGVKRPGRAQCLRDVVILLNCAEALAGQGLLASEL
jgi:hypothetical protein